MDLFKTTSEIKQYIGIDVNMKIDKLKPSIEDAELRFIKPLLGAAFYAEFVAAYKNAVNLPADLTDDQQALLPYIQRPLAFYTAYLSVDEIGVQVGDLGIQQQFNQNSQPAPAWKVAKLTLKYISSADAAADKLLEYLETNASAVKYGAWFGDMEANTAMSGTIVHKTSIASKYIDINESRRIFLRLKKRIQDIEASYVKRLICNEQYDEILTQLRTGNSLTAANGELIRKLEPIISKKALYLTLPSLAISIESEGIMMFSSNDSVTQKQMAGPEQKKLLMQSLKDGEFGYVQDEDELNAFLTENIDDYPLIADSPCWTSKPDDGNIKWQPTNDPCNSHFSA